MDDIARPALAVMKSRLGNVALGDGDRLVGAEILQALVAHGVGDLLPDLLAIAAQEAFAIFDGLVLARQSAVDHCQHASFVRISRRSP